MSLYDEMDAASVPRRQFDCPWIRAARISVAGPLYEPSETGVWHVLFPVFDRVHVCRGDGDHLPPVDLVGDPVTLIDIVAWRPEDPGKFLTRCGMVDFLGALSDEVVLYPDPLAWHDAGQRGAVILDWSTVAWRLIDCASVTASTLELAERADQELRAARKRLTPPLPKIGVLS